VKLISKREANLDGVTMKGETIAELNIREFAEHVITISQS